MAVVMGECVILCRLLLRCGMVWTKTDEMEVIGKLSQALS